MLPKVVALSPRRVCRITLLGAGFVLSSCDQAPERITGSGVVRQAPTISDVVISTSAGGTGGNNPIPSVQVVASPIGPFTFNLSTTYGASYGPQTFDFDGPIVPIGDACVAPAQAAPFPGAIAFIERGICTFQTKTKNAEDAGYLYAAIYGSAASPTLTGLAGDPTVGDVHIPTIGIDRPIASRLSPLITAPAGSVQFSVRFVGFSPSLTIPPNITATTDPGVCTAVLDVGTATARSHDGVELTAIGQRTGNIPLSNPYPRGQNFVFWSATDGTLTTQFSQTILVGDVEPPVLTTQGNISVAAGPGATSAAVTVPAPTATDNCPRPTPGFAIHGARSDAALLTDPFPLGTTTVTWTTRDAAGNTGTSVQTVTVTAPDNAAPTIVAPANIQLEVGSGCVATPVALGTATTQDDAPGVTVVPVRSDGAAINAPFPKGTTTITWTATDAGGLIATAVQTVRVDDTTPPTIAAPAPSTWEVEGGHPSAFVTPAPAVATDYCEPVTINSPPAGFYPIGTTTVAYTATDASGNSSGATTTITVQDTRAPVLSVPGNQVVNATSPTGASVSFSTSWTDNSGVATVSCTIASGGTFAIGTTTNTCFARDASGNTSAPRSFMVTVLGASDQLANLIEFVGGVGIPEPYRTQLMAGLQTALTDPRSTRLACPALSLFINTIRLRAAYLPALAIKAPQIITDATRIRAVMGCP